MKIKHSAFLFKIIFLKKRTSKFYKFIKEFPIQNKHLELIMSDGRLFLAFQFRFYMGIVLVAISNDFFLPKGKYFKENP